MRFQFTKRYHLVYSYSLFELVLLCTDTPPLYRYSPCVRSTNSAQLLLDTTLVYSYSPFEQVLPLCTGTPVVYWYPRRVQVPPVVYRYPPLCIVSPLVYRYSTCVQVLHLCTNTPLVYRYSTCV